MAKEASAKARGVPAVTPEEVQCRRSICQSCNHYDYKRDTCTQCGCRMSLKTTFRTASCPLHHW